MNKCIKFQIIPYGDQIDNKNVFKQVRDTSYMTWKACNLATNLQFQELMRKQEEKKINGEVLKENEVYGKSFSTWLYDKMNEYMSGCLSSNVAQTRQFVMAKSNFNPTKILRGEESLATFKHSMPVILHNKAFSIKQECGIKILEIGLFNREKQKELGVKRLTFSPVRPDDSTNEILNRIMNGEYKQGSGQLQFNKKGKLMLTISYSFESKKTIDLNDKKILGIDLGVVKTATMSVYNSENNIYERLNWKERFIDGDELIHFRQKTEARRKKLLIASKWCSDNKIGHGRTQRLKNVDDIGDKVAKFRDTYNHKVSRYIVDMALKYNCGVIQMEDLSGFTEKAKESFLKNWSYYDLQQKVNYKAEEVGVKVNYIKPQYTSKRCSECGCIHDDNRDCKNSQAKFKCVSCGYEENADINASKNIALPNIEELIVESIKLNKTA